MSGGALESAEDVTAPPRTVPGAALLDEIGARAPGYFPGLPSGAAVSVTGKLHSGYSDVYRLRVGGGLAPRDIVVKVFEGADRQYRAMCAVWPRFALHDRWKIPRPLDCLDGGRALIMEAVPGTPLAARWPALLWAGSIDVARADCRWAGAWLRFYHDLGREAPRPLDLAARWSELERTLHALAACGFDADRGSRLTRWLEGLARRTRAHVSTASHLHGDFKTDNLLVDGERVTGLDLWSEFRNNVEYDIASFLNSLLLLQLRRVVSSTAQRECRVAFLAGYFGGDRHDDDVIRLLQGFALPPVALEVATRRRGRLARRWVHHVVGQCLDALAAQEN